MKGGFPTVKLKYVVDKIGSGKTPLGGSQAYVQTGVMLLRSQNVHFDGLHLDDVVFIDEDTDSEMASSRVEPDDVLLNITGASLGRCTVFSAIDQRGNVNQHVCIIRSKKHRILPAYLNGVMQSAHVQSQIFAGENGSSREGLTFEQIGGFEIPIPGLMAQRTIADYLDRETARLDALVAAKERVLGLLAEKRRALITRAVTRGLDPRARLRDSGIPWLGEIPAHWAIWKLGHLALVGNGSTPNRDNPEYWSEGEIPWLNSSVVNQEEVTAADQFVTVTALRECHLPLVRTGSVLVGITGQGKTRGKAVVLSFEAAVNQHIAYITPRADLLNAWFLRWALFAAYEFLRSISDDAGGTKGALTCEEVASLHVPLPPMTQQRAIVEHIAATVANLAAFRFATERTIELLKERRAALISAAVTGQIDVGATA